ncbi:MAG TPA: carboxymuconolactone decarboxylase family protein [Phycisphaerales bacterium]|nr:carboxymuconolactone decarboxylase family protein [Phycisphaerales bacterium]HRQ76255.1 carboxymuconolactone decarboxylase family protein [Phycisphaerales bacterium]
MQITIDEKAMRAAFDAVKDDPVFAESAAAVRAGKWPVQMFQALSLQPSLLEAFTAVSRGVYPGGRVEREVKEVIILEASRRNACQFCTQSHIAMCRMIGLSNDPLAMVDDASQLTERQMAARELTRAVMTDSNSVPTQVYDRAHAAFADAELVEVVFMIGFINCLNLFNNTLGVRYEGEYA